MNTVKHIVRPASFLLAALLGLSVGACNEGENDGELRINRVCKRHCSALEECTNKDYDTCVSSCVETANECDSDSDVDMSLDKLDACQEKECVDIAACSVDAWFECKL
jgi:hypothetical protein